MKNDIKLFWIAWGEFMKIFKKLVGVAAFVVVAVIVFITCAAGLGDDIVKNVNQFIDTLSMGVFSGIGDVNVQMFLTVLVIIFAGIVAVLPLISSFISICQRKKSNMSGPFENVSVSIFAICGLLICAYSVNYAYGNDILIYLSLSYLVLMLIYVTLNMIYVFKGEEIVINSYEEIPQEIKREVKEKQVKPEEDFEIERREEIPQEQIEEENEEETKVEKEDEIPSETKQEEVTDEESKNEEELEVENQEEEVVEHRVVEIEEGDVPELSKINKFVEKKPLEEDPYHREELLKKEEELKKEEIVEEKSIEEQLEERFASFEEGSLVKYETTPQDEMVLEVENHNVEPFTFEDEVNIDEDVLEEENNDEDNDEDDLEEEKSTFANVQFGQTKSFEEKINLADEQLKQNYNKIKNTILSYKKVSCRMSKTCETFRKGYNTITKLVIRGKAIKVYLPIDPNSLDPNIYHQRDASATKKYESVPTMIRVRSNLSCKKVCEILEIILESEEIGAIKNPRYQEVDYTNTPVA